MTVIGNDCFAIRILRSRNGFLRIVLIVMNVHARDLLDAMVMLFIH